MSGSIPYKYKSGMEQLDDKTWSVCTTRIPNWTYK